MVGRIPTVGLIVVLLCSSAFGGDAMMGDYEGTWSLAGQKQPIIAQVIPEGDGKYRAVLKEAFNKRVDTIIELRGTLGDKAAKLSGKADQGPAAGTQWSATTDGQALKGMIQGEHTGQFAMDKIVRLSPTLGLKPPRGAVVLFDGTNLDLWTNKNWKLIEPQLDARQPLLYTGRAMEIYRGGSNSTVRFTDHRVHLEFRTPYKPKARGQGRGNSGVYIQGRFEIQVLDSYGLEGRSNECGALYGHAAPRVNACAPPLQWQTFDVLFRAARYNDAGKTAEPARITVLHNGIVIHNNATLRGGPRGPGHLHLQDHGNPVQYRNIWVVPLD